MNDCDEYAIQILRYLDEDLEGEELEDFLSHLDSCAWCREQLEAEKELSATLHRSRPLYSAPVALRDRVAEAVIGNSTSSRVQDSIYRRASRIARDRLSGAMQSLARWQVLAPAALAIVLCLAVVPNIERRVQAARYIQTAVASHRSYINGDLRPELESSSPERVTAWFAGKVPFDFRLPAESTPEKNHVYRLTGASLVNFKGSPAALVTYEGQNDKISLLVDSSKTAIVAGGDEVRVGKLTFHYHNDSGFGVVTWTVHGLSYALVSSVSGPARTSCLVCHQNMADSSNFETHQ
jgi:mycothiol system anti-sigma-R factor